MKQRLYIVIAAIALVLAACSSLPPPEIWADYDTNAIGAMRAYETYDWLPDDNWTEGPAGQQLGEVDVKRFVRLMEDELLRRGYARVTGGDADFLVGYHAVVQRKMQQSGGDTRVGVGFGSGGTAIGVSSGGGGSSRTYDEATFVIDFVDRASDEVVWTGTARGAVRTPKSPEERDKQFGKVVKDILKNFPPKKSKH